MMARQVARQFCRLGEAPQAGPWTPGKRRKGPQTNRRHASLVVGSESRLMDYLVQSSSEIYAVIPSKNETGRGC